MNTKNSWKIALSGALLVTTLLTACAPAISSGALAVPVLVQDTAAINPTALAASLVNLPVGVLSESEAAALQFMREEEKLAHDVYLALYDKWQQPTFQNIAASEQTHTDAVKALLERYGVADPAVNQPAGQFTNADLQALYDQLVATGQESLASALRVGAAIEEIDILDLKERVAQTDKADIQLVYNNLTTASYNHLRSFVSTLEKRTGEVYTPQYLDAQTYQQIIAAAPARGGKGGR